MNARGVSEICFEETYVVPEAQTAMRLFADLPHSTPFARSLVNALATAYLVAIMESICIRELRQHIDPNLETIVGTAIDLDHCAPAPVGAQLWLRGWTEQLGDRDAVFRVRAHDAHDLIGDGTIRLAVVERQRFQARIDNKVLLAVLQSA
jgi:fluoroacetyl-CoA thioesterase